MAEPLPLMKIVGLALPTRGSAALIITLRSGKRLHIVSIETLAPDGIVGRSSTGARMIIPFHAIDLMKEYNDTRTSEILSAEG